MRSVEKWRTSLSSAPDQPRSWLARESSVLRRAWVKVISVPPSMGFRREPHRDYSPRLRSRDEAGIMQNVQVLHHRGQLDREGLRKLAHSCAVFALEARKDRPASPIHQRRKSTVEPPFGIVHHMVNYTDKCLLCQSESVRVHPNFSTKMRFYG